jgi:3-oxoacyl-[acyl-carrier protein] reductase
MAKLFSENGARVIVCDMGEPRDICENGEFYKLNVTDAEACKRFAEYATAKYKKIDILVNNAGITKDGMTRKMTEEMWDAVIAVNLTGVFNLTRFIGPHMEDTGGSIIIISSVVGEYGNIGQVNYAAAKAGVIGMTKSWAKEFARKGVPVRCNAIASGYIMTNILKTVPQELLDKFAAATMLGRLGQPEEIVRAALFLASDDASYITGTVLSVNGGMRL